jgi:hypothetical protein
VEGDLQMLIPEGGKGKKGRKRGKKEKKRGEKEKKRGEKRGKRASEEVRFWRKM